MSLPEPNCTPFRRQPTFAYTKQVGAPSRQGEGTAGATIPEEVSWPLEQSIPAPTPRSFLEKLWSCFRPLIQQGNDGTYAAEK